MTPNIMTAMLGFHAACSHHRSGQSELNQICRSRSTSDPCVKCHSTLNRTTMLIVQDGKHNTQRLTPPPAKTYIYNYLHLFIVHLLTLSII